MNNNLIQIEKSKYTALLRRVLGLHFAEHGVPQLEAILNTINYIADNTKRAYDCGANKQEIEDNIETLGLALDYYHLCKDDMYGPNVEMQENSINLRKD